MFFPVFFFDFEIMRGHILKKTYYAKHIRIEVAEKYL
jgi:hypothetical protein